MISSAGSVVAPVWFFGRLKGFAFVKFQDFFSFAGESDRPDVHYFLVTPTLLWRLSKSWFAVVDSESRTDWKNGSQTSFRSGVEIGTMLTPRLGAWIKPEIPWGPHRAGDWTLQLTFFVTRY
jgi:hypothetical protein